MAAGRTAAKTKKQSRKRVIRYGFDGTAARQPETVEMPRRQAGQAAVRAAYGIAVVRTVRGSDVRFTCGIHESSTTKHLMSK